MDGCAVERDFGCSKGDAAETRHGRRYKKIKAKNVTDEKQMKQSFSLVFLTVTVFGWTKLAEVWKIPPKTNTNEIGVLLTRTESVQFFMDLFYRLIPAANNTFTTTIQIIYEIFGYMYNEN